jgi:hypothetical protein
MMTTTIQSRKRILFMTVGTGVGTGDEKIRSLAKGLSSSILCYRPDEIYYFGSDQSKITIDYLKKILEEQGSGSVFDHFILLDAIDDFNRTFQQMEQVFLEVKNEDVWVDYTSGTKTMTSCAVVLSVLYHLNITLVGGTRDERSVVKEGTENNIKQNLYSVYDKLLLDKVIEHINSFQFTQAASILTQIKAIELEQRKFYDSIIKGLNAWDKFQHNDAFNALKGIPKGQLATLHLDDTFGFLGKMTNPKFPYVNFLLIADLLNNAERRLLEGRYDDAVGRLYRCIEMIGQTGLKNHNLDSDKLKISDLATLISANHPLLTDLKKKEVNGLLKVALEDDFRILDALDDPLGKEYLNDKKVHSLLSKRNYSILAHGFDPIMKEDAESLLNVVIHYADCQNPEMIGFRKSAQFPKIS